MTFAGALSWGVSWSFSVWLSVKATGHKPSQSGFQSARSDSWSCCVTNLPSPTFNHAGGWLQQGRALRHPFGKTMLYCTQRRRKWIQILQTQGLIMAWHLEYMWHNLIEVLTGLSYHNWNFADTQTSGRGLLSAGAAQGHHHLTYLLFIYI